MNANRLQDHNRLDGMSRDALQDYARDLLYERGEAASDIDQRRQDLPYHPLLAQYESGSETVRGRLSDAILSLVGESAKEAWPVDALDYLMTFVEETRLQPATEKLKSYVHSKAWLLQPEGPVRQMFALRTLLGLGWYGDPNFWLQQDKALGHSFPVLVFRALAEHDLRLAFSHLGELISNADHADQLLTLFPSLIEEHSLHQVRSLTESATKELAPELASAFSVWFDRRGYKAQTQKPTMESRRPPARPNLSPYVLEDSHKGSPSHVILESELEALERGSPNSKFLALGMMALSSTVVFGVTLFAILSTSPWIEGFLIIVASTSLATGFLLMYIWGRSRQKSTGLVQRIRQRMLFADHATKNFE